MRCLAVSCSVVMLAACTAAPHAPPDRLRIAAAAHDLVGDPVWTRAAPVPVADCASAENAAAWRDLRRALGGAAAALPDDFARFAVERVVALRWPVGEQPTDLFADSEEGVDVLTFVTRPGDRRDGANCCLLRLPSRPQQLAVVVRDGAGERTLATYLWR